MKEFSILINSCDAYSDVWPYFFRILEKVWPQAVEYPIYLNTETKEYHDPFFNIHVLNCEQNPKNTPWGWRLLQALERIDTPYVLFMLEDFFFEKPVLYSEIDKCIEYLNMYKDISVIGFTSQMECEDPVWCKENTEERIPGFVIRKQMVDFKFNAGPSLWRKSFLQKVTFKKDSPWEWEFFGNRRTWLSKDKIYGRAYDAPKVFEYDIIHGGAIHRGKWSANSVRACIEKYNLDIELSIRGVEEEKDFNPYGVEPKAIYKRLDTILKNKMSTITSILYGLIRR